MVYDDEYDDTYDNFGDDGGLEPTLEEVRLGEAACWRKQVTHVLQELGPNLNRRGRNKVDNDDNGDNDDDNDDNDDNDGNDDSRGISARGRGRGRGTCRALQPSGIAFTPPCRVRAWRKRAVATALCGGCDGSARPGGPEHGRAYDAGQRCRVKDVAQPAAKGEQQGQVRQP